MRDKDLELIKTARAIADVGVQKDDGERYVVPAESIVEINRVLRALAFALEESIAFERRVASQEKVMLKDIEDLRNEIVYLTTGEYGEAE